MDMLWTAMDMQWIAIGTRMDSYGHAMGTDVGMA